MTKKEIVKAIADDIGLTQLKTKEIVQKTFDAIVDTLVTDKRIELRNFGVFEVKKRAARKARNPRTGERVDVAEKYVVTFKPGKEMEERVKQMSEGDQSQKPEESKPEGAVSEAVPPVTAPEPGPAPGYNPAQSNPPQSNPPGPTPPPTQTPPPGSSSY